MSNDGERSPEDQGVADQNPTNQGDQSQEWEAMARAWLRAFPEAKAVSAIEVEGWIDVNRDCLPTELKFMELSELIEKLLSIQNILRLPAQAPEKEAASQTNYPSYRFQRTDQWRPVYSWLESLETDEVVKSQDIADWLANNPEIRDQLSSKHSRYHLTHYIKKCHMKILKRKEKLKVSEQPAEAPSKDASRSLVPIQPMPISSFNPASIPQDSDLYASKRTEAVRKYEILVALEKQLLTLFPNDQNVKI